MEVDDDLKKKILIATGPVIGAASVAVVVGVVGFLLSYIGINIKNKTMAGDQGMHPTTSEVNASNVDAAAADTDAAMAKDELAGVDGDLSAGRTDAAAGDAEAKALESGASAARTKAGAADIETKGLKMT